MGEEIQPVDEYIMSLPDEYRAELNRIKSVVLQVVPEAIQGKSYGMPAFLHKGKPVISVMVRKNFLSLYPFSGKVLQGLKARLSDFECTSGSVHFSTAKPIPEVVLRDIISARVREIEAGIR